ncbi:MAG: hypothetical protein DRJ10_17410, partial [Bacteroidetes bacterium]
MKKINLLSLILLFVSTVLFQSCDKTESVPKGIYDGGVFITNEGAFGKGNASVSFYSFSDDAVVNNIFEKANGRTLGDVVQSISFVNDKAYICVNASNKIEIAGKYDFKELGVINDLTSVRYFTNDNSTKGYATVWGDNGQVKVIDLTSNQVSKSIDVGNGPEQMVIISDKLYVANSGGYGSDNTISVINTITDELIKTITLDADIPIDLIADKNENLWILCSGNPSWASTGNTAAKLIKMDTETDAVIASVILTQSTHPKNIAFSSDGNYIYYGGGYGFDGIYKIDLTTLSVPTSPFISKGFYGF